MRKIAAISVNNLGPRNLLRKEGWWDRYSFTWVNEHCMMGERLHGLWRQQENRDKLQEMLTNSVSPHGREPLTLQVEPLGKGLGTDREQPRNRNIKRELSLFDFLVIPALGIQGPWSAIYKALFFQVKKNFHWRKGSGN